jgi:uncharacterized protein
MPRRTKPRKVVAPPGFKGYRPYGDQHNDKEGVVLLYEEYEAIKLADYDQMNHLQASKLMGISRPTFARIYESARQKIATALAETRSIITSYGNAVMDESWNICYQCHARFTTPGSMTKKNCPICGAEDTGNIKQK